MLRKIYFGDNLEILRELETGCVHLVCTDPPFNSGRNYNTFLKASQSQRTAFVDTWTWDDAAQDTRREIGELARTSESYAALNNALTGYDFVLQKATSGAPSAMRAYLTFMGPRILELHRVLHPKGSMYLHCDPTASHYLKGLMDAMFGVENFRNEIAWHYSAGSAPRQDFKRKHDIILRYVKGPSFVFNQPRMPYAEKDKHRFKYEDEDGRKYRRNRTKDKHGEWKRFYWDEGTPRDDVFTYLRGSEMNQIGATSKERLGYPTQKPRALYERLIEASSNPGDIVLDPFCGCGTTIDAAETLNRQWIGIDVTLLALDPMQKRLRERHGLEPSVDYEIIGYPTNMQEVMLLIRDRKKYHDFANWAVTRIGLEPTANVGDGGFDGIGAVKVWDPRTQRDRNTRIIAEVKSGKPSISALRAFCHTIREQKAQVGIFITVEPISRGMKAIQESMGTFQHNGVSYPRLQFWQIDDGYFADPESLNKKIRLPWRVESRHKSERHFKDEQPELPLRR